MKTDAEQAEFLNKFFAPNDATSVIDKKLADIEVKYMAAQKYNFYDELRKLMKEQE